MPFRRGVGVVGRSGSRRVGVGSCRVGGTALLQAAQGLGLLLLLLLATTTRFRAGVVDVGSTLNSGSRALFVAVGSSRVVSTALHQTVGSGFGRVRFPSWPANLARWLAKST